MNISDLRHIYNEHYGDNEKDKGNNIPLTDEDIRSIVDVLYNPDDVIFGVEKKGEKRKLFFFLKDAGDGAYNLTEVYADRRGNLTAKSYYKTKKGSNLRAVSIKNDSELSTSETSGASLFSGAKIPTLFEISEKIEKKDEIKYQRADILNDYQERITAGQELKDEVTASGHRASFNADYTINLVHGTSPEAAEKIKSEGLQKGSYLAPSRNEANTHVSAKRKDNTFLTIRVDARDISYNGATNEYYAEDGLVMGEDGVWVSPQRKAARQANGDVRFRGEERERKGGEEANAGEWYDRNSVERIGEFAGYSPKQIAAMNARQEESARRQFKDAAEKLHLGDRIEFAETIDDVEGLTEKQREARRRKKGWYDPRTGKIVIILGNHRSMDDVMKSIMHEGVAHHGLRQLFGEHFDRFLDNVYGNASAEIRARIVDMARKHGWNVRTATEEYLAQLAEDTEFEKPENQSWWRQVKAWFIDLLHKIGFNLHDAYDTITDNELRYILWRSYENLVNPGRMRSIVEEAKDVAVQYELGVGDYGEVLYSGESKPKWDNRGYTMREDGTRVSRRGLEAEEEGRFPRGTFKRKYRVPEDVFVQLRRVGAIETGEWHHTGKAMKKTPYFGWLGEESDAAAYARNKAEIDRICEEAELKEPWEYGEPNDYFKDWERLMYRLSDYLPSMEEEYRDWVNRRFNDELERFEKGTMRTSDKFDLGMPSPILRASGISTDHPIEMTQSVLAEHMKKHGLTLQDIKDLPQALQTPIMVYTWGEKAKSHIVITDMTTSDGRKITTAIRISDKGGATDVTRISSVHGKDAMRLISEMNTEKSDFGKDNLKWVDKERTLDWLSMASPKEASATSQEFNSAAKIVKNFENPQVSGEESSYGAESEGEPLFRDGEEEETGAPKAQARAVYERMVSNGGYQLKEAMQDSMLSLKRLYEAVINGSNGRFRIEEVKGYENAYLAENRMHSMSEAQIHAYQQDYMKPLQRAIHALTHGKREAYGTLTDYMMAKHGLERNRVFAERDTNQSNQSGRNKPRDYAGLTGELFEKYNMPRTWLSRRGG